MPSLFARGRTVEFPRRPLIMGILNINDDSFSSDGRVDPSWARERAKDMVRLGADIIDVGAESARTNREAITVEAEIARLVPFIEGFDTALAGTNPRDDDQVFPPLLSLNTWRPEVVGPCLRLGGHILNDIGGLPDDANARNCARAGAALLIMHSVGLPKIPHTHVGYDDVMATLDEFFRGRIQCALAAGVPRESILLDPGIDFAKQKEDNLIVFARMRRLVDLGFPVLLPVSRKSVIGRVLGVSDPRERDAGTVACVVAGVLRGAAILRVHHVDAAWRVVRSLDKLGLVRA